MAGHTGPLGAAAAATDESGMMIKDLNTGQYISLAELEKRQAASPATSEQHISTQVEAGSPDSSSKPGWLKGAKNKMAKVAKKTLDALHDKPDEQRQKPEEALGSNAHTSTPPLVHTLSGGGSMQRGSAVVIASTAPNSLLGAVGPLAAGRERTSAQRSGQSGGGAAPPAPSSTTLGPLAAKLHNLGTLTPLPAVPVQPLTSLSGMHAPAPLSIPGTPPQQPVLDLTQSASGRMQPPTAFLAGAPGLSPVDVGPGVDASETGSAADLASPQSQALSSISAGMHEPWGAGAGDDAMGALTEGKARKKGARAMLSKTLKWGKAQAEKLKGDGPEATRKSSSKLEEAGYASARASKDLGVTPGAVSPSPRLPLDGWVSGADPSVHDASQPASQPSAQPSALTGFDSWQGTQGPASDDESEVPGATPTARQDTGGAAAVKPTKGVLRGKLRSLVQQMKPGGSDGGKAGKGAGYRGLPGGELEPGDALEGPDTIADGESSMLGVGESLAGDPEDDESALAPPKGLVPSGLGQCARTQAARGTHPSSRIFGAVRLVQRLPAHDGIVWVARFNPAGTLLATGGQDGVVRVWRVASSASSPPAAVTAAGTGWAAADPTALPRALSATRGSTPAHKAYTIRPSAPDGSDDDDRISPPAPTDPSLTASLPPLPSPARTQSVGRASGRAGPGNWAGAEERAAAGWQDDGESAAGDAVAPGAFLGGASTAAGAASHAPGLTSWGPAVLSHAPVYVLHGHAEDVLDLSWSAAGNFLLTASVDGMVRMWHIPAPGPPIAAEVPAVPPAPTLLAPLGEYPHPDFVTSVAFHPCEAGQFATGCVDGRLRVWDAVACGVLASAVLQHDMITCVTWMPDPPRLVVGTLQGRCRQYELQPLGSTPGLVGGGGPGASSGATAGSLNPQSSDTKPLGYKLEYLATIDVKDRRVGAGAGRKVTCITCVPGKPGTFLTATNDSRLRMYHRYTQEMKLKGCRNTHTLIKASLDDVGRCVVCGSDTGWVYVWDLQLPATLPGPAASSLSPTGSSGTHVPGQLPSSSAVPGGAQPAAAGARARVKHAAYDAFLSGDPTVTVALVAPRGVWRTGGGTSPGHQSSLQHGGSTGVQGLPEGGVVSGTRSPGAKPPLPRVDTHASSASHASSKAGGALTGAPLAGPSPAAHSPLLGAVFVVAGYKGQLLVYENCAS